MKIGFTRAWGAMMSWPKQSGRKQDFACHFCDTLHSAPQLEEGTSARCRRCGGILFQNRPASLVRASAFAIATLLLMTLGHFFPMLTMSAAGLSRQLTLMNSATALMDHDAPILGISIILFTMVCPLVLVTGMLYVCLPLLFGRAAPFAWYAAKWAFRSEPWNMVEVFLLGVLVSLLKLAKVSEVHFGIGFWALAGVMLCIAGAIAAIDRNELWDRLEVARK